MTPPDAKAGLRAIVTLPPYAPFAAEVAAHPMCSGLRLNTVMPLREGRAELLQRLTALDQPIWVDLKGRQLRVVGGAVPPYGPVPISHRISVPCPADAFLSDGREQARIVGILTGDAGTNTGDSEHPLPPGAGCALIFEDGPRRFIGPGESINILHPRLKIHGGLTTGDRAWLAAMREVFPDPAPGAAAGPGGRRVMLSFVERAEDAAEVRALLPGAAVVEKIESVRGLEYARRQGLAGAYRLEGGTAGAGTAGRLMAARGDLFVEVGQPHRILTAMRWLIGADPDAILASRVLGSLARNPSPDCADISDVAYAHAIGYRTVMLGDEVCLRRDSVIGALNLLQAICTEL